ETRSGTASLDASKFLQARALEHFRNVQVTHGIRPDPVRAPELARIVAPLTAKTADHVALEIDNADAVLELRHVHDAVGANVQLRRALEAGPHIQVLAVWCEDLDAIVLAVGNVNLAALLPDGMHRMEVVGLVLRIAEVASAARLAPRFQQRA